MKVSALEKAVIVIDSFGRSAEKNGLLQGTASEVKIISVAIFIVSVVSFHKYTTVALIPYFFMLALLTAASRISFKNIFFRIVVVAPFIIFVGIFNPIFDEGTVNFFGKTISAGWISFISIILKFILTLWCALLFVSTTKFQGIVQGLKSFKIPVILANQFYFLFRYIRLLLTETLTLKRAREARLYGDSKFNVKIFATLVGTLAIRCIRRSDNIHDAMLARGFNGDLPQAFVSKRVKTTDILFAIASFFCCIFFRFIFIF